MIKINDLHKSLAGLKVLKGINLEIEEGEIIALLGSSGAGKSVLLKNIVGLMTPDSGEVLIKQKNIHTIKGAELSGLRDSIGMLFQSGALFDSMTVRENLAFPLREKTGKPEKELQDRVDQQLKNVDMLDAGGKYPAELSGGMRKRAALARCLILEPEIIFFDEPTTGLDPLISNSILRLIYNIHEELGFTAVIITHNFEKVFPIAHRVAMIDGGKIIACDKPEHFMDSDQPKVSRFVAEATRGPLEALNIE
jgi:phospholipid/cholesterol/gamma-HCH transport system ATP-binding protein